MTAGAGVAGRGVQSIEVGGRVLAAMATAGKPLMLRDIALAADLASAQAHAYLVSFRKIGLVEQLEGSALYQLGPFALQLGLARMRSVDALRLATVAAPALAAELGLMVTVTVWGSLGATVVQVNEAGDQVHVNLRAGTVYSLLHTATGRVFAAFLGADAVEAHLGKAKAFSGLLEPENAESSAELWREIEETRVRGYSRATGSPIPGVNALAAPVFDHTGEIKVALTAIGPSRLVDVSPESAEARRLLAFTRDLSTELGFRAAPDGSAISAPPSRRARPAAPPHGGTRLPR
jgi:DNA-binding IclR family transcriptional regulator